jgi:hypothetical protein
MMGGTVHLCEACRRMMGWLAGHVRDNVHLLMGGEDDQDWEALNLYPLPIEWFHAGA